MVKTGRENHPVDFWMKFLTVHVRYIKILGGFWPKITRKTDSAQSLSNKCKKYLYSQHINFLNTI